MTINPSLRFACASLLALVGMALVAPSAQIADAAAPWIADTFGLALDVSTVQTVGFVTGIVFIFHAMMQVKAAYDASMSADDQLA